MPRIIRSPRSKDDYLEIWLFVARDSETAADELIDRFEEKLQSIADNPRIGKLAEVLARGLRVFPVGRYLIFYRETSGAIELVRVLHGAREIGDGHFNL